MGPGMFPDFFGSTANQQKEVLTEGESTQYLKSVVLNGRHCSVHDFELSSVARKGGKMEGILFLVLWFGCAALHTVYDLKIKPLIATEADRADYPNF